MARQLLKHIDILATMEDVPDDAGTICGRELKDAAIIIDENVILSVGPTSELADDADNCDEVHDLSGHIALPGLVNTHHHLFQNLTRVVPAAQDSQPIWLVTDTLSDLAKS